MSGCAREKRRERKFEEGKGDQVLKLRFYKLKLYKSQQVILPHTRTLGKRQSKHFICTKNKKPSTNLNYSILCPYYTTFFLLPINASNYTHSWLHL